MIFYYVFMTACDEDVVCIPPRRREMNREMLDYMVTIARREVRMFGYQIDKYGEALLRQALLDGQCVQITLPQRPQTICPMAVTGNNTDSHVWFIQYGVEDLEMLQRFDAHIVHWVSENQGR